MNNPRSSRRSRILSGLGRLALVAGAALIAWQYTVRPLEEREARIAGESAALGVQIEEARRSIKEVQALEQHLRSVDREVAALHRNNPEGPPLVWFPMRVKEHFHRFKCAEARIRSQTNRPVPGLPGHTRIPWQLEMPVQRTTQDIRTTLFAILEIEAADPFVRIQDVVIGPDSADPSRHVALATISLLAPRR